MSSEKPAVGARLARPTWGETRPHPTRFDPEHPPIGVKHRPNLSVKSASRTRVKDYLLTSWDGEPEREVADLLGVSQKTVNRAKEELQDSGKLSQVTQFSKEEKRQQVREYIDANPDASNREVADAPSGGA